jgi:arginine N-succinyltransferase
MRGVLDSDAHSPFWTAVGRHFVDKPLADLFTIMADDRGFVAETMPHHPIYVDLLPYSAQKVIGKVHEHTEPALSMLQHQGFVLSDDVDVFDAGPRIVADTDDIATVASSVETTVDAVIDEPNGDRQGTLAVIGTTEIDFRATTATIWPDDNLTIDAATASALKVGPGSTVRYASLT